MREHVTDVWVQRAKAEGYRSRAAFKLMQLQERDRLLRPGMTVVDLGATPGGWSQVASKIVGPAGRVIAVDLLELEPLPGVRFIRGDFGEDSTLRQVEALLEGRAVDLVLSDMAPNMSGIGDVDQIRAIGLAELALDFACRALKPDGAFVVKVFHGAGFDDLVRAAKRSFKRVVVRKPEASRGRSSENYLLAQGLREAASVDAPRERLGLESDQIE